MSDEMIKGVNVEAPKRKRGISNETKATAQLKFTESDCTNLGLFIGSLSEVTVAFTTGKENTNFAGLKLPHLTFHFTSEPTHNKEEEKRHLYHTLFPVESNIDTIPGGKQEWRVNNVFNWIKHILDIYYLDGRQLTEQEEDALSLPFMDYDDNGEYIMLDPQEILDGYGVLFTNVANMLNGQYAANGETPSGKPSYRDGNGKVIPVWMKLLRHKKRNNEWTNVGTNGDLAFDSFIGSGCIERYKGSGTFPKILKFDAAKESITPKETKKAPNLGTAMPGMLGGSVMAGAMPMGMPMDNSAFVQAGSEDSPF